MHRIAARLAFFTTCLAWTAQGTAQQMPRVEGVEVQPLVSATKRLVDALDYALVEAHFFKDLGLRPYRIIQYPRADMKAMGEALVPMRMISRDFQTGEIDEARVVNLTLAERLDPTLFTLRRLQEEPFALPSL